MMQVTGKVLAAQRFLAGLSAGQLDALATTASEVMFPAGRRIFADGGYADRFWLIESGYLDLDVQVPHVIQVALGVLRLQTQVFLVRDL